MSRIMNIQLHRQGPLIHLEIARPERRNALGTSLARDLSASLDELESIINTTAGDTPTLVITCAATPEAGGPIWIAGGDLKELSELKTEAAGYAYAKTMCDICLRIESLPIVTIMAVDGAAIGGGAEFALAGDLRLATKRSSFDFKQLKVGLATGYGGATRLLEAVGNSRALGWVLLAKRVEAEDALHAGLVHELYDTIDAIKERATFLAAHFAALPRGSITAQKRMLRPHSEERRLQLERELSLFSPLWLNPHHAKVLQAFVGRP